MNNAGTYSPTLSHNHRLVIWANSMFDNSVYDLAYHDGDTTSYIAVFNDGVVAFVPTSSNGQDIADLTKQYVTR